MYMAYAMGLRLKVALTNKEVAISAFPAGLLRDAEHLFHLAEQSEKSANLNIASKTNVISIITHCLPVKPASLEEVDNKIRQYSRLIHALDVPHKFSNEELEICGEVIQFFTSLYNLGEEVSCFEQTDGRDYWQRHSVDFWNRKRR
jgi:hypothetical protein